MSLRYFRCGQYSRTEGAQQKDHSHSGDIYHTVVRAHMGRSYEDRIIQPPVKSCLQTHKQLLHGIRGSRASSNRYYTDRPAGGRTKNWEHRKQDPAQQHDRGMAKEVEQCNHRAVDAQAKSQPNPLAAETTQTGRLLPHADDLRARMP